MEVNNHRLLADNVEWFESPNHGDKLLNSEPDSIILHYTAGSSAKSSVQTLSNPDKKVSAHLIIGRDGEIFQLVPFDTIAWHAGRSSWQGRDGYNQYSIGIELDNAGLLTPTVSGDYMSWFNRVYKADSVLEAIHRNESSPRFWHKYTEQQIDSVFEVCSLLCNTYPIKEVLGHEEIAPSRKTDPGPAFPLERLRNSLLGSGRQEDLPDEGFASISKSAKVITPQLNVRSGPGTSFAKSDEPLKLGNKVDILDKDGGWVKVRYYSEGWVSAKYIENI